MLSQREGVYAAIKSYHAEKGRHFEDGMKVDLSKEDRSTIIEMVAAGISAGEITFSDDARTRYSTDKGVRDYCGNLLSNWLRRDERLNGQVEYQPKNPGSRFGQKDEVVKNLRALAKNTSDETELGAINSAIATRQEELRTAKMKSKVKIDLNFIPESLRHLAK